MRSGTRRPHSIPYQCWKLRFRFYLLLRERQPPPHSHREDLPVCQGRTGNHWSRITGVLDGWIWLPECGDRVSNMVRFKQHFAWSILERDKGKKAMALTTPNARGPAGTPLPDSGYPSDHSLSLPLGNWWVYMCIPGAQMWMCRACIAHDPILGLHAYRTCQGCLRH